MGKNCYFMHIQYAYSIEISVAISVGLILLMHAKIMIVQSVCVSQCVFLIVVVMKTKPGT